MWVKLRYNIDGVELFHGFMQWQKVSSIWLKPNGDFLLNTDFIEVLLAGCITHRGFDSIFNDRSTGLLLY